jgi:hypothetical protein
MSTPQPGSTGSQPGQGPPMIAIDPKLARRLVKALERIGNPYGGDGRDPREPDPTRVRTAQDYDVLRGLLGRTDAPRALRMHRDTPAGGGQTLKSRKNKRSQASGDNVVVVEDPFPASASLAVVESPGAGSGTVREEFDVKGGTTATLELIDITAKMAISRVEIYDKDDKDRNLVAFGPSAAPIK